MSKLSYAAEQLFSRVEGATVEHRDELLICTATPKQIMDSLKGNPLWKAMTAVLDSMTPCLKCCDQFIAGRNEFGVAFTLKEDDGTCSNCGTRTSDADTKKLLRKHKRGANKLRTAWSAER